jgi:DNA-binding beta-propeller fold protein YncE
MGISKKTSVFMLVFVMGSIGIVSLEPGQSRAENKALYGVNSSVDGLFSIKKTKSVNVNVIGKLNSDSQLKESNSKFVTPSAMAVRPSDGALFVWNNEEKDHGKTIHTGDLLEVDKCSGTASVVAPKKSKGLDLNALAFGEDGVLYGLNDSLYQIDTNTGETRPIGAPSGWFYRKWLRIGAADFDPKTGTLYAVERRHSKSQRIVTVNTNTGEVTKVGMVSKKFAPIGSIVFTREGTLIGSGGGGRKAFLFEMDTNGNVLKSWQVKSPYMPQGMALAPSCGETNRLSSVIRHR